MNWSFSPTKEVASIIKMSVQEVHNKLSSSPDLFTHGFKNVASEIDLEARSIKIEPEPDESEAVLCLLNKIRTFFQNNPSED